MSYKILQHYKGLAVEHISDEVYKELDRSTQKMYYKEVDEDEDYIPTSSPSVLPSDDILDEEENDNSLVDNIVLATDLGINLDEIVDPEPEAQPDPEPEQVEMGGGSFGGAGAEGDF